MELDRLFIISIILIIVTSHVSARSFIPSNETFRPVYSHNLTGYVSPDRPFTVSTDIRDSNTGFFRIFGWGPDQDTSDIDLRTSYGREVNPENVSFNSTTNLTPEVITVRNLSSDYMLADPGVYTTELTTAHASGIANVHIQYIYRENLDMGLIQDKAYSIREITIPPGLSRVLFICESAYGTDLDLFVQTGTDLPDSFSSFNYSSTSSCTDCWDLGVDNWIAEVLPIDNPEPGKYLMVTYARSGEDFFTSYMMGVESEEQVQAVDIRTASILNNTDIDEKYRSIPFRMNYSPEFDVVLNDPDMDIDKAFTKKSDPGS